METIYAIVENGVVVNCIVADGWHDGIDISALEPMPGIGWAYDASSGAFTPPPSPAPVVVRRLTQVEFFRRFTAEERISSRSLAKTDPVIEDAYELMKLADFIDLDDADTLQYVQYLEHVGALAQGRAAEILGA